ncbi:tail fiber protein [Aquimarina sp. MMG016]|uniref:tail fiber protein n=1 Tax=Aquimarina sp. MMG016 TaxID=2822690 RepID=UPI001FFD0355|nr:tail fiber protein [Aquimarina sp. MMG016]
MKKSLLLLCLLVSSVSIIGQTTTFDNLNANYSTNKSITWYTSNYGSGFGHRIINSDPGGKTLLNFQGRHNSTSWINIMSLTSDGKMGIGTTSPAVKLHVLGNTLISSSNPTIHIEGTGTGSYQGATLIMSAKGVTTGNSHVSTWFMTHRGTDGTAAITLQRRGLNGEFNGSLLSYKDGDGWKFAVAANKTSGLSNAMNIMNDGKIGIGTTTPDSKLTVVGHVNIGGNGNYHLKTRHIDGKHFSNSNIDDLYLNYNTGEHVLVGFGGQDSNLHVSGNIGIGTTSPDRKLDVIGGDTWQLKLSNATEDKRMFIGWYKSRNAMEIGTWGNGNWQDVPLRILPKITTFDGNVGIGTTTPDAKLTVKGNIHAEEVKIDLSVPAPDYVFTKDYDLLTIEEVQQHIAVQGHLPNIPSAKEMETNGVELGLMNMKLLEKIEELTLYTIAQEKQLKEQKSINNKLDKELENQKSKLYQLEEKLNQLIENK